MAHTLVFRCIARFGHELVREPFIPRSPELEAIVIDQPATTAEALAATRGTDGLGLVVVEDAAEAVMPKAMPGQA